MKLQALCIAAALALVGPAFAAEDKHEHAHEHKPLHGGIVVEASHIDFELVARADVITLHVRDHGKPTPVKGGSGKLTLLSGATKSEAALAPAGDSSLEARGAFTLGAGTKIVATVQLPGRKPINVRFALKG